PDLPQGDPPTLLSATHFQQIADETLRLDNANIKGQRAPYCADQLTVAMTLSNSQPLPYASRIKQPTADGDEAFIQFRYAEQETFVLGDPFLPNHPIWERISAVARASAAIPFVFSRVSLTRTASNVLQYIQTPSFQGEGNFWYFDGGTFNN